MIQSLILRTAIRYLFPLLLLFALFLLLRGHYLPGGGFVAGLVAASAFALVMMGFGVDTARRLLYAEPVRLMGVGLLTAVSSAMLAPLLLHQPFMYGIWLDGEKFPYLSIPAIGVLGTPMLFDIGVFLTVLGVVLHIIYTLGDAAEEA
jgi:multicomponent Na+:H+ antiporter subunit B